MIGFTTLKAAKKRSPDVIKLTNGTYAAVKGNTLFGARYVCINTLSALKAGLITSLDLDLL